ncbi:hypothetical protein CN918_31080 [Priestia megaterium]|nr:hypothetical protein CN918_31080 [Priestia megaterium]
MMRLLKLILLVLLCITFFMPWYNAFGGEDVSGLTIPSYEEVTVFYLLYATPLFSIISFFILLSGRDPGGYYFLAGLPVLLFWVLLILADATYVPWNYSYPSGRWCLSLSVLVIVTSLFPARSCKHKRHGL